MGSVKVEKFGGMLPAWESRFLPDDQAEFCQNAYLYSGAADGWRTPKLLRALTNSAAKFAYRVPTITQGIAGANLLFTGNPSAGDQVTLGEITYTFTATPQNPFDVLLGSNTQNSAAALFFAMQYGTFDPTIVGLNTPPNPALTGAATYVGYPQPWVNTTNTPSGNSVILVKITPQASMQLTAVNLVPQGTNGAAHFTGVVYENTHTLNASGTAYTDIPTTLIGQGQEQVGAFAGIAVTSALPIPLTLAAGNTYWIGFMMDTAVSLQVSTSSNQGISNTNTYTNGPPNPFQQTTISGVTTNGTSVGSLQTQYNTGQPTWMIWGNTQIIDPSLPIDQLQAVQVGGAGSFYNALLLQAPAFGTSFNLTPLGLNQSLPNMTWLADLLSFNDTTTTFVGGANQTSDKTITGSSTWLEFLDQDTNVVRTPVVNDTFERYYIASPSQPPQYNTRQRIAAGQPSFYLGVPAPPIAPTLSVIGGGIPTQMGFPNSNTASTFPYLQWFNVGGTLYQGYIPFNNSGTTAGTLVLYPMQTSVGVSVNDIGIEIASMQSNSLFEFTGMIFADISATDPTQSNKPGDQIAVGSIAVVAGSITTPTAVTSTFTTPPNLAPNTQYWVGALLAQGGLLQTYQPNSAVVLALGDNGTQGQSAIIPTTLPKDTKTGALSAPAMTAGFPDLQLWADLGAATGVNTAIEETRAYVYTWVTAYGEEGPPSPPALLTQYNNATWKVGLQPPLVQDLGTLRNIVKTNIYRTMSSQQGGTVFFFVGSVAATAGVFMDTITDDVVALNAQLPSTTWFAPPATLQGITAMPNGMFAGFRGNEVWFSEPFRPHAWPSAYVMTTDYPIVGLGVVGTTLVACTTFNPNTFTGVNPATMSQDRIPFPEPCLSRGSILSTDSGVYYESVNGLIRVTGAKAAVNFTQAWITRERWDALVPQKLLRAVKNVSTYFAFGTTGVTNGQADVSVAQQGFAIELSDADRTSFSVWPQVGGHRIGFTTLSSPLGGNIDNVLTDPWSGVAYLITGGSVYYYDFTDPAPQITKFVWRSKKFQGPHKENFSAYRVWFDIPPGGPQSPPPNRATLPATFNPPVSAQMAVNPLMFGVVRIIADGFYITERELRLSTELMRVASFQKYTTWQIEIESRVRVTNVKMATTVKELGLIK